MFLGCISVINAQVKISNNPSVPVKSASLLELESTNKGIVFPRVSLTALNTPAPLATDLVAGTLVYNTNDVLPGGKGVYVWQGTAWATLVTSSQRGGLQLQDSATGNPTLVGNYAYVADEAAGLQILNPKALVNTLTVTGDVAQIGALKIPSGNGIVTADGNGVLGKTVVTNGLLFADANGDIIATNNYVNTNTAQTIGGAKNFSSALTAPSFSGSGTSLTGVVKTTGDETIDGEKTFTGTVKAAAYTSPQSGTANMVAVAYGSLTGTSIVPASSSNNYTVVHNNGPGVWTITFTSPSSLNGYNSIANLPTVATLSGGVSSPGFITYNGGIGVLTIYTYNSSGVLTDRGFSFTVYKP